MNITEFVHDNGITAIIRRIKSKINKCGEGCVLGHGLLGNVSASGRGRQQQRSANGKTVSNLACLFKGCLHGNYENMVGYY